MLANIPKSAHCLTIASVFSGISGCASDGGASELAAMGLLVGGAASGDTGLMVAGVAGYAGIMLVAPILADDPATGAAPSAPASAVASPAASPRAVAAPPAARVPATEPAKPANTINYCYAYLTVQNPGSTCSPVVEVNDADSTGSVFQTRLNNYIEKVKQSQPGTWGEFEYSETTQMFNAFIYKMKPKAGLEASKQEAGLICTASQANTNALLKSLQKNDSTLKMVGWP